MTKDLIDEITDIEVVKSGYKAMKKLVEIKDEKLDILNGRIDRAIEWVEKNKCQFHDDDNELVKSEISFIVNARPYEILHILRGDK